MQHEDLVLLVAAALVKREVSQADGERRKALVSDLVEDLTNSMVPGDRTTVRVRDANGTPVAIGTVRVDDGPVTVTVTNPRAYLDWVKATAESEIEETVREAYTKRVAEMVKRHGGVMDPDTGEIAEVPGMTRTQGQPKVVVTPASGAKEAITGWYSHQNWLSRLTKAPTRENDLEHGNTVPVQSSSAER
ncbi:hypothetical protein ACWFMI_15000 [Nocardiopsis terrae]